MRQAFDLHVNTGGIHGVKWNDLDRDGLVDAGEPTLEGWTIYIDANQNGQLDAGELNTVTDANGDYAINNLPSGSYPLAEVQQPGWVVASSRTVVVGSGLDGLKTGIDFGNFRVVNAGADRVVNEGTLVALNALISDPNTANGGNLTRLWHVTASNGQSIADGTGTSFNFTPSDEGTYTVTMTVTDADDGNKQYVDTVEVLAKNVAPLVNLGADRVVNEGTPLAFINFVTDAVGDSRTYAWELVDGLGQAVQVSSAPTYVANTADEDTYAVRVTVTDDDGASASDEVHVTVHNVAPTANISPLLSGDYDRNGSASLDDYTFWKQHFGETTGIGLQADGNGNGKVDAADFTVWRNNLGGSMPQTLNEGAHVSLGSSFSDPGTQDSHSFLWHVVSTNGQQIADGTGATFDLTLIDNGVYTVTFTVTDDDGGMTSDVFVVSAGNVGPLNVNAGPNRAANEGDTVGLAVSFTDIGTADTHFAAWTVQRGGVTVATGTGANFSFVPADEGLHTVTVVVADSDGAASVDTLDVNVSNVSPIANAGGPYNISEGQSLSLVHKRRISEIRTCFSIRGISTATIPLATQSAKRPR